MSSLQELPVRYHFRTAILFYCVCAHITRQLRRIVRLFGQRDVTLAQLVQGDPPVDLLVQLPPGLPVPERSVGAFLFVPFDPLAKIVVGFLAHLAPTDVRRV